MTAYAAHTTNLSTNLLTAQKNKSHTKEFSTFQKTEVTTLQRTKQNKKQVLWVQNVLVPATMATERETERGR